MNSYLSNAKELYQFIISLPRDERIKLLTKDSIRRRFLDNDAHYPFVWLVQQLNGIELKYFIDSNYLTDILNNNNRVIDKISAIMTSCNQYATDVLLDDRVIDLILDSSTDLSTYLYNLDYRIGHKIIDYDIKNSTYHLNMLASYKTKEQLNIFNTEYIIKLLNYNELSDRFLVDLKGRVIEKLINFAKFQSMFLNSTIYDIDLMLNNGLVIPKRLFDSNTLIDKYIKLDTNRYRDYVNSLMNNNYEFYEIIEKERLKYVDNKINSIKNDILEEYNNYDKTNIYNIYDYKTASKLQIIQDDAIKLNEYFKYSTKEKLLEMIIDVFFKDVPYNFLQNLKVMINYSKDNPKYIPRNIDIYNTILNFNELSINDIINFFNKYKNKDLATSFYDDFRKARNIAFEEINNGITKFDKNSDLYEEDISKDIGIDIYELNGEDFYLYIHSSRSGFWANNKKTLCLSLISHDNISTIDDDSIMFGFSKLNINNIMHMYHSDSFSLHEQGTHKIHDIETKENLIKKTTSYNEILYKEEDGFKPDYIVCFDIMNNKSIESARKLNIPLIIINSMKYTKKHGGLEVLDVNNYLNGSDVLDYDILEDIKLR